MSSFLLYLLVSTNKQGRKEDLTMWSVTLRLLWFLAIFRSFTEFQQLFFPHFVRQLSSFLPKEHTFLSRHLCVVVYYTVNNHAKVSSARCGQLRYVFCGFRHFSHLYTAVQYGVVTLFCKATVYISTKRAHYHLYSCFVCLSITKTHEA